jgi:toxin-antitoxin system PIN domain toxin
VSYAVDANLLLYASDASSRFHERALEFLSECYAGPEIFYLPWPTAMAYLRIATHPSIFERPLSPEEARRNIEQLLARPHVRAVGEQDGFWNVYLRVIDNLVVRGSLVPDAHLFALLIQHEVGTLWTHDRDFLKFSGIRIRDPFE